MGSSSSVLSFKHHSRTLNPLWDFEKILENWHFAVFVLLCNIVQLRGAVFLSLGRRPLPRSHDLKKFLVILKNIAIKKRGTFFFNLLVFASGTHI